MSVLSSKYGPSGSIGTRLRRGRGHSVPRDAMHGSDCRDVGQSKAMTARSVVMAGGGSTGLMLAGELALARADVVPTAHRQRRRA